LRLLVAMDRSQRATSRQGCVYALAGAVEEGIGAGEGPTAATTQQTTTSKPPGGAASSKAAKPKPSSGPPGSGQSKPRPSIAEEEAAPGDHSIQNYGAEAGGEEKAAVLAAMRSFIAALASSDYARACAALPAANREQMQQFFKAQHHGGSCAAVLAKLLSPAATTEAKKALGATISKVRVGEGNAFVLFRPAGGKLSYFVMKEEGGAWKATSLAAGSPLYP